MSDVKCAKVMYRAAERDGLTLRSMTADAPVESFGFHVQQAAEKCFKAWIAMLGEEYPLTHDLGKLIDVIRARDAAVSQHAALEAFSAFAVNCRYGPLPEDAGTIDRPAAIRQVEALRRRVRRLLPSLEE